MQRPQPCCHAPLTVASNDCAENPYDVADEWLVDQDLPQGYREQVVHFIIQNTGQTAGVMEGVARDPYTGGGGDVKGCYDWLYAADWRLGRKSFKNK